LLGEYPLKEFLQDLDAQLRESAVGMVDGRWGWKDFLAEVDLRTAAGSLQKESACF